jgi:hypothetical protein
MVRCYLHDCEYAGINGVRNGIRKEAAKLKVDLYKHIVHYKHDYVGEPPPLLLTEDSSDPTRGKGKAPLHPSYLNAAQGATTRRREFDSFPNCNARDRHASGRGARIGTTEMHRDSSHRDTSRDPSRNRRKTNNQDPARIVALLLLTTVGVRLEWGSCNA